MAKKSGVIPATGFKVVAINDIDIPSSLAIRNGGAGATITVSPDNNEYITLVNDFDTATQKVVYLKAPMGFVKFTGTVGATWLVL